MKRPEQQEIYEDAYEENYDEDQRYEDLDEHEPELIATSHSIRLTCTLAALSSVFALFLYFADKESRAVRRTAVQSVALGAVFLAVSLIIMLINLLFSFIPIIKIVVGLALTVIHIAAAVVFLIQKLRLMFNAYRGYAYILPGVGEHVRKFE